MIKMTDLGRAKVESSLKRAIIEAVDGVGGLGNFIERGDVVFLKPNFNTADPFPASTDLDFLKTVVELTYQAGAKLVMIGDSSTMSANTRKVMERIGVSELLKMERPPRIYIFEEGAWVRKEIPGSKYLKSVSLPEIIGRADKMILLPCLKTHKCTQFSGSLKLSVGFIKPYQRIKLHLSHLQEKIAELNTIIKPDLIIMDARKCFINKGPSSGGIGEPNLILASPSRLAIDVEGIKIIKGFRGNSLGDVDPWKLPQIKKAKELGIC